jgi:hypothetical protein
MENLEPSDWIAIAALIVSILSAVFAWVASNKANKLAKENTNIQHGLIELELRQAIEGSKSKINDVGIIMAPLKAKSNKGTISEEDKEILSIYDKNLDAAIQTMLNTYDDACSKYLDYKVDRVRFKKNYHIEIRNLLERQELKEYFDPLTSRYKPILKVYDEWNNQER